jgi:hypothetical protein
VTNLRAPNLALATCAAALIGAAVALFLIDHATYLAVIDHWSFYPVAKPFSDAEYVTSQIQCWRQGVDVYVTNPCDMMGRLQNLSPLWLRLPLWPANISSTFWLGLTIDGCFAVSLLALPRRGTGILLLALISPVVVFALERANQDLIMFVLIMLAILLLERTWPVRIAGYGLIVFAGLLKFYPLAAMSVALRERRTVFTVITASAVALTAAFIVFNSAELKAMLPNIPYAPAFELGLGATRLPNALGTALATMTGLHGLAASPMIRIAAMASLAAATLLIALRSAEHLPLQALSERELLCLIAGAALICGCFLTGRSAMYRGIDLLFALPGLIGLAGDAIGRIRAMLRVTVAAILLSMFSQPSHRFLGESFSVFTEDNGSALASALWLIRELMWWWIVAVLLAVLLRFGVTSNMWRALRQ